MGTPTSQYQGRLIFFTLFSMMVFASASNGKALAQQASPSPASLPAPVVTSPSQISLVTLAPQEASIFQKAIQAVASQAHVTVVAEDAPLHPRLLDKMTIPLSATPAPELLAKIATAYDYDLSRVGAIYLLKKRYSNPRDLPAVTPEECTLATQDITNILTPYDPSNGTLKNLFCGRMLQTFIASLTPEQVQALQSTNAATGLSMTSLGEQQQEMVHQFTASLYLGGVSDEAQSTLGYLSQASRITVRVEKQHRSFSRSSTEDGHVNSETWSQDAVLGFDAAETSPTPRDTVSADTLPLVFHPFNDTPPAPTDLVPAVEARPEPGADTEGYTTLAGVVSGMAARGGKFAVVPPLRAKPLSVYGVASAVPTDLFAALAAAYGLRVGTDDAARKVLMLTLPLMPDSFADVTSTIHHALPEPLRRAIHDGELEQEQKDYIKAKQEAKTLADLAALDKMRKAYTMNWFADKDRPDRMHWEAVCRLHNLVDTQLAVQGRSERVELMHGLFTPAIKLSTLPASAKSAFAVALLAGTLSQVNQTLGPKVPQWVADVDTAYLIGGPHPVQGHPELTNYSLSLSYPGSDGVLCPTSGAYTGAIPTINATPGNQ